MYKPLSKQIGFEDFNTPLGMKLDPENRWVKKANTIPWDEIEAKYAKLFQSKKGQVAKPLRMALGALIVQKEYGFSDENTVREIQENPFVQFLCGARSFEYKRPFDPSLMVYFRERLTPEILGEINELIIAKNEDKSTDDGDCIVDASCAPQNIRYPQDISLLNEAREKTEAMIDELHEKNKDDCKKPRTYRKEARKEYLKTARKKKKKPNEIRKGIGKQLRYIKRNLAHIEAYKDSGSVLDEKQAEELATIKKVYEQQHSMWENKNKHIPDRIVSISQPWIRPIVRGKASKEVEFGAKFDISVSNGFVRLEHTSFDAYNESTILKSILERYKEQKGNYPKRVLVDQIYRTRDNINFCKENNIEISGKPLGRKPKIEDKTLKKKNRQNEIDRIEVERKISEAKGNYGLSLIRCKLKETSKTSSALSILCLNIAKATRLLRALILFLYGPRKIVFVQ